MTLDYENFVSIIGPPRTGHHAVSNWFFCHLPIPSLLAYKGIKCRGLVEGDTSLIEKQGFSYYNNSDTPDGEVQHEKKIPGPLKYYGITFCCSHIEEVEKEEAKYIKVPKLKIIVIRDYFNWWASFSKGHNAPKKIKNDQIEIMRELYKEALNKDTDYTIIYFNKWFCDRQYRKGLIESFGFPFTDVGLNFVPCHGYGSTWDQRTFQGRAQEMNVLTRWKEHKGEFPHKDMAQMSIELFGGLLDRDVST
ncbi:MAG: hypothetical protein ACW99J_15255 [Candidatus Thorarchaeota archaeon]